MAMRRSFRSRSAGTGQNVGLPDDSSERARRIPRLLLGSLGPLAYATRFRVTPIGDPDAADVNDANIRIARATIEMLRPTAETLVAVGTPLTIFYKHSLGARARVAIDISSNNGTTWRTVAEAETTGSTTSSFRWLVDLLPVSRARVRIRALDGSGARDVSRAFSVTAPAAQVEPHGPGFPVRRSRTMARCAAIVRCLRQRCGQLQPSHGDGLRRLACERKSYVPNRRRRSTLEAFVLLLPRRAAARLASAASTGGCTSGDSPGTRRGAIARCDGWPTAGDGAPMPPGCVRARNRGAIRAAGATNAHGTQSAPLSGEANCAPQMRRQTDALPVHGPWATDRSPPARTTAISHNNQTTYRARPRRRTSTGMGAFALPSPPADGPPAFCGYRSLTDVLRWSRFECRAVYSFFKGRRCVCHVSADAAARFRCARDRTRSLARRDRCVYCEARRCPQSGMPQPAASCTTANRMSRAAARADPQPRTDRAPRADFAGDLQRSTKGAWAHPRPQRADVTTIHKELGCRLGHEHPHGVARGTHPLQSDARQHAGPEP